MRKLGRCAIALLLVFAACSGGEGNSRTILVDYSHDEFASNFTLNFPRAVTVAQGAELVWRQTWTGEPHSVTGGTMVDEYMEIAEPILERMHDGEPVFEPPQEVIDAHEELPYAIPQEEDAGVELNQTAVQPCYLATGKPRLDGKPCSRQEQPRFNGKQTYYNSGLIPYAGPDGNEFRVQLASDIEPGAYWFYCNYHGGVQSTKVTVAEPGAAVPSQQTINMEAQKEVGAAAQSMVSAFESARDDNRVRIQGPDGPVTHRGPFAGIYAPDPNVWGFIDEFVPRHMDVGVNEEITWTWLGPHTISFGVPRYLPIVSFDRESKRVDYNVKLDSPAGGAEAFDFRNFEFGQPFVHDGGTYDGSGFWSSGLAFGDPIEYTMRISKAGTYKYACLIHPPMVGTITVS